MKTTCPQCTLDNVYLDGDLYICPDCGYEYPRETSKDTDADENIQIKDANGNILNDGDSVTLIKDLKVKGSSLTLKKGTKVKSIRIVGGDHDVDCRIDGVSLMLKSCFLKKA